MHSFLIQAEGDSGRIFSDILKRIRNRELNRFRHFVMDNRKKIVWSIKTKAPAELCILYVGGGV